MSDKAHRPEVRDELQEAEAALRREHDFTESLLETAPAIVLVLDTEGRIVRFNRYMEEISGYSLEEVRGTDWLDTFVPESVRPKIGGVFNETLDIQSTRGVVNPILTRHGSERQIEWFNKTLRDADGEVTGVLAIGQDITERKQLEEQFRQSQKMEAIGRLAGGIAHDFNTLLGSILGYSEMQLAALKEGDPLRRPAAQIKRAAERGVTLTRQLLAMSRHRDAAPEIVDLAAAVDEMDDMLRRLVGEDIELATRLDPECGRVEIDRGQLEQVILNLVVNAADAMPRGGRMILGAGHRTARAARRSAARRGLVVLGLAPGSPESSSEPSTSQSAENDHVVLEVRDTGVGMDEETRNRIFEPFFTTKEPGKGTGLGLYTVYGIVKQYGGSIVVDSQPGKGTTFEVHLPRVTAPPSAAPTESSSAAAESARGSEVVMVVEDDEMFRELIGEILEGAGYTVLQAAEPAAALELVEEHDGGLDLLVSDMVMPGMTGSELARRLAERRPALKVLLMSGYTPEDLAGRGGIEEGVAFIEKPFKTAAFTGKVREVLDG